MGSRRTYNDKEHGGTDTKHLVASHIPHMFEQMYQGPVQLAGCSEIRMGCCEIVEVGFNCGPEYGSYEHLPALQRMK